MEQWATVKGQLPPRECETDFHRMLWFKCTRPYMALPWLWLFFFLLPYLAAGTRILCPVFPSRLLAGDLLSHLRFYSFRPERNSPAEQVGRNNVYKSPRRHPAAHATPVHFVCYASISRGWMAAGTPRSFPKGELPCFLLRIVSLPGCNRRVAPPPHGRTPSQQKTALCQTA